MPSHETQRLAERIAKMLEPEPQSDIATVYATLEKINHRLDKIEQAMATPTQAVTLAGSRPHPSLDKLSIAEAIADEIFAGVKKEKACQFEPGKPCDHCSMCNSRGF